MTHTDPKGAIKFLLQCVKRDGVVGICDFQWLDTPYGPSSDIYHWSVDIEISEHLLNFYCDPQWMRTCHKNRSSSRGHRRTEERGPLVRWLVSARDSRMNRAFSLARGLVRVLYQGDLWTVCQSPAFLDTTRRPDQLPLHLTLLTRLEPRLTSSRPRRTLDGKLLSSRCLLAQTLRIHRVDASWL